MIVAKIQVSGAIAHTLYKKVIPAGIIGAQIEFEYAEDIWQGLHKTVVFRGPVTKDVVTDANIVTIPPEVVEKPRSLLIVGVYGVDAEGNLAIPTVWAELGLVRESASPSGDPTTDPSLPVWAQLQGMIGDLDELETTARDNLVAAVNEALSNGGNADYGAENVGKLLYVGSDGFATVLALGAGLAIVNGVLTITSQVVTSAICGQAVCGNAICGGA